MGQFPEERLCYNSDSNRARGSCFNSIVHILLYRKSSGNIILHRRHRGRRCSTSDGTPETVSICSETGEGRACTRAEAEPLLVLESPTKAYPQGKISATACVSFWAKEMAGNNSGDPIIIFRERDDNAQCQVWGAENSVDKKPEDEKLRDAEEEKPPVLIQRGPTEGSVSEARLTKAGSFPVANSTSTGFFRLTTRKHKESEFWSFPNTGKGLVEDLALTSSGLVENDMRPDLAARTSSSSTCSVQKLETRGWDRLIKKRFDFIKQRLKRVLSPRKSRPRETFPGSSLGSVDPHEHIDQDHEHDGSSKMTRIESSSDCRAGDGKLQGRSRTSSLNESIEKYARLLGNSFSTDAKLDHSRSLSVRNADQGTRIFRRRLSLPDLDSLHSLLGELEQLSANTESISLSKQKSEIDVVKVGENEGSDTAERTDSAHLTMERDRPDSEAESTFDSEIRITIQQEAKFTDTGSAGLDVNERSVDSPHSEGARFDSHNISEEVKIMEDDEEMVNLIRSYYKLDKNAEANFNLVRDFLELSGLFEVEGSSYTWFSPYHHMLNHSLLKDSDILPLHDLNSGDREILLDLVNESLDEVCSRSLACIPKDKHEILEEVWKRVHWYQSLGSDVDRSSDEVIARDMRGGFDIWMNLGVESEDVGLELEDLIFYELLDEVSELLFGDEPIRRS